MKVRFIAITPFDKAKGLMYSRPLESDEIAIFKFDRDNSSGFWNKNVNYPIEIYFYDADFNLVGTKELQANQEKMVYADKPYRYVVEVADSSSIDVDNAANYLKKLYGNKL